MEDAKRPSLTDKISAAGIAIPFLMAVTAYCIGPRAKAMAVAAVRPALAFDQYLVDLGPVAPSEEVFAHFDFTNRGRSPIKVTKLVPSCGCLQPRTNKSVYRPGESGNFVVHVKTANENPGLKEYRIGVQYTDPEPREAEVTFRVILPDNQVMVRPRALIFYPFQGQVARQTIEITDKRAAHLNIVKVECTKNLAEVWEEGSQVDDEGHWHGRLKINVPTKLPPGRHEAMVRIFTDDPEYKTLRVPLIISDGTLKPIVDPNLQPASGTR